MKTVLSIERQKYPSPFTLDCGSKIVETIWLVHGQIHDSHNPDNKELTNTQITADSPTLQTKVNS